MKSNIAASAADADQQEAHARALERAELFEDAAGALDTALRLEPNRQSAIEARARISLRTKDVNAVEHCRRALDFYTDRPDAQLQMIMVAAADLGGAAIPLLEDHVRAHPASVQAHARLAEMRAEAGAGDSFASSYLEAFERCPNDRALKLSYWGTLSRAGRHQDALALIDDDRKHGSTDRQSVLLEIAIATHAGLSRRAGDLLRTLGDAPDAALLWGQHWLQMDEPAKAVAALLAVLRSEGSNLSAWAMLAVAWRLTGDPRHAWLCEQPNLWASYELGLSQEELAATADTLRSLHRTVAHPIGQSLRGGTQTGGLLLERRESGVLRLKEALADAVRRHLDTLPPFDPNHPLLRFRNASVAFGPSWSVRLANGGFHVAHIHPGGIMSSACYISLPNTIGSDGDRDGWLELGRPPAEFALDLPPLAAMRPEAGRLVLFPSFLFHGTRPFAAGERLTVAFDIVPV